jgi:hypothetical protein
MRRSGIEVLRRLAAKSEKSVASDTGYDDVGSSATLDGDREQEVFSIMTDAASR